MATAKRQLDQKKAVAGRGHRELAARLESPMAMLTGSHTVASLIQFFAQVGVGHGVATPDIERRVGLKRTALQKGLDRLEKAHLVRHWTAGRTNVYAASESAYWEPLAKMAAIEARGQAPAFEGGFAWLAGKLPGALPERQTRALRVEPEEPMRLDEAAAALVTLQEVPEAATPRLARLPRPRR
jgi:hypothetical protein